MSCLQHKNIIVDKNQSIPYFLPHCGIQCSIPSKVCPLRKRLPLSCHKNSSQIFDATKLWKHTIPLTYNTKTLISNISETHCFSPQMRLIAYPDHKTTLNKDGQACNCMNLILLLLIVLFSSFLVCIWGRGDGVECVWGVCVSGWGVLWNSIKKYASVWKLFCVSCVIFILKRIMCFHFLKKKKKRKENIITKASWVSVVISRVWAAPTNKSQNPTAAEKTPLKL